MPEHTDIAEALERIALPPVKGYLSTGSTLMDLAISNQYPGGVGIGRITQIFGDESTAKTVLVQEVLGAAQRAGGHAILEDAERTLDFWRTNLFGLSTGEWGTNAEHLEKAEALRTIDKKKTGTALADAVEVCPMFTYRRPHSIEQLFDDEIGEALTLIAKKKIQAPVCIGVDSVSALPAEEELTKRLDEGSYRMGKARIDSAGFRKYITPMADLGLTIIAIDQTRDAVGAPGYGPKKTVSGGHAIEFYSSTRVQLSKAATILNEYKQPIGVVIKFVVVKNKLGPPFREGRLHVLFDIGVDDVTANLEWLKEHVIPEMKSPFGCKGAWFNWGEEKIGQGMVQAVETVEKVNMEKDVEKEVARIWALIHKPLDRKPRHT